MSAKTEDVEAVIERLEAHAIHKRVDYSKADLRTLLASHAAQAERIASLEAGLGDAIDDYCTSAHAHHSEGCANVDNYANVKRWRALLSGKAS
jgi:hypothetical protein